MLRHSIKYFFTLRLLLYGFISNRNIYEPTEAKNKSISSYLYENVPGLKDRGLEINR